MQKALDTLVADVDPKYISAARVSAGKVLDTCFGLTGSQQ